MFESYLEIVALRATNAREASRVIENIRIFCDISVVAIVVIVIITAIILLLEKKEG